MVVMKKYEPSPDYTRTQNAAFNIWSDHVPLYEHIVGGGAMREITGSDPGQLMFSRDMSESREGFRQFWDFWRICGYDTASMEFSINGILYSHGGGALGSHRPGAIKTRDDFNKFPWDDIYREFFNVYDPYFKNFADVCPNGMKAIGGAGNGLFESIQDIVGYIDLCYMKSDDEELYTDVFRKMGELQIKIWERVICEYGDVFCIFRFGDDLGFNTQTLISTEDIKKFIIPVYAEITSLAHKAGKPFLLHSCGNIFGVMNDLINNAHIDAKHSNEDSIAHFTVWVDKYGDSIGNFGGIDTDVLCRFDRQYIREYIFDCLNKVKGHGGIAFSSGNSIPDYVPIDGYLAMIDSVREWRGDFK